MTATYEQVLREQKAAELRFSRNQYEKLRQSNPRHPVLGLMADSLRNMEATLEAMK